MPERLAASTHFSTEAAFRRRGYMLDVSRDRVPTLDTVGWLIDVLAALRFNELQLYTEHTFAFSGHDDVWRDASPYTSDEMRWIRDSAAASGISLVPSMNTFGHMERWLRHDSYRHRAECPDGWRLEPSGARLPPTSLEPTVGNADFAIGLVDELREAVGGDTIMIGGDEPFELGQCRSAADAAQRGRGVVYREHLGRIMEPLLAKGFEVQFWGDQFRIDPEAVEWIPDGAMCVIWNYDAPGESRGEPDLGPGALRTAMGLPDDDHLGFEAHARLLIESGKPFWLAPGTCSWNSLIGRNGTAEANIRDAATVGLRSGASGLLVTDWGDGGHWQPLGVSLPSMVRGGLAAWSGDCAGVEVGPIVDDLLAAAPGTGALLDELGHLDQLVGVRTYNGSAISAAVLKRPFPMVGSLDREGVEHARAVVDSAITALPHGLGSTERGQIMAEEMVAICGVARVGLRRLAGESPTVDELEEAKDAQRRAWLRSSRPGGLTRSLSRFRKP